MADRAEEQADFHWLTRDGQRLSGSELELRAALSRGALGWDVLVWRKGWPEWKPAGRVPELSMALPAPRTLPPERKSEPRSSQPSAVQMPPLVARTPISSSRPLLRSTPPRSARAVTAPPARATTGARATAGARATGATGAPPPPAPSRARPAAPRPALPGKSEHPEEPLELDASGGFELGDDEDDDELGDESPTTTDTLRPPGAVPPPPAGVPAPLDSSHTTPAPGSSDSRPLPSFPPSALPSEPSASQASLAAAFEPDPASAPTTVMARPTPTLVTPAPAPAAPMTSAEASADSDALASQTRDISHALASQTRDISKLASGEGAAASLLAAGAVKARSSAPLSEFDRAASESSLTPDRRSTQAHSALREPPREGPARSSRNAILALSALSATLLATVLALVSRSGAPRPAPEVTLNASSASPAPLPPIVQGCRSLLPAARIAANVERRVLPAAAPLPNARELALGFAASGTEGVGVRLNLDTLDVTAAFDEDGKDAARNVVPLTLAGALSFFVDREQGALRSAHTENAAPPFAFGLSEAGFARMAAGQVSLIWPLAASDKVTEPRLAELPGLGYGVTFRRGGQAGRVLLGFTNQDGTKHSALTEIPGTPRLVGTPVIAGSAQNALVAFAGRDTPEAAWQVFVSSCKPGAVPSAARALLSGSGGGAISPALAAQGDARWLVQWTEGSSGQYQVHVQSFTSDLSPLGARVLVSPKGTNAGQGILASSGARGGASPRPIRESTDTPGPADPGAAETALSLFVVTTGGHDELWGATLACQ